MKEVKTERTVYDVSYEASDGRMFDDKEACLKYEKSLACALKSNLRDMSIRETSTEEDLFYTGSCENEVFIVMPKTEEDILHIKQVAIGFGNSEERVSKQIDNSDINSIILVTIGYNDEWAFVARLNTIIKNIVGEKYKLVPTMN